MTYANPTPEWMPVRAESYLIYGFTGQGQQNPSMLQPWYGYSDETDALLSHFHEVTETPHGESLDPEALEKGSLMQPANVTLAVIGCVALAKQGIQPNEAFGHSLGEYGAVHATGFVGPEDIITLARRRGECTDKNISELVKSKMPTGMLGISSKGGQAAAEITELLQKLKIPEKEVGIGNFNTGDQVILSGASQHFESIKGALKGTLRAFELGVDGPYHSLHMRLARLALKEHVDEIPMRQPKSPKLYSPTTVGQLRTRDDVSNMFLDQLIKSVRYPQLIDARLKYLNRPHIASLLGSKGANEIVFVEIGPYNITKPTDTGVLIGLTKRNVHTYQQGDTPISFHRISTPEDLLHARLTS